MCFQKVEPEVVYLPFVIVKSCEGASQGWVWKWDNRKPADSTSEAVALGANCPLTEVNVSVAVRWWMCSAVVWLGFWFKITWNYFWPAADKAVHELLNHSDEVFSQSGSDWSLVLANWLVHKKESESICLWKSDFSRHLLLYWAAKKKKKSWHVSSLLLAKCS